MTGSHRAALDPVTAADIEEIRLRAAEPIARLAGRTVLLSGGEGFLPS